MILVTGANGTVGGEIARQLVAAGHVVRALVRSQAKAAALPGAVEIALGDFADTDSLARAVAGVDAIYMTSFESPEMSVLQGNLIAAARTAAVRVVVRLSGMGAHAGARETLMRDHGICDRQLSESGLGYVLLQPNWFYQNFPHYFPGGVMRLPVGSGRASLVDVRDIAAVAVAALMDPRHLGKAFVPTGPEALSHAEVARALSQITGRRFVFEDVTDEAWRAEAIESGWDPPDADTLIELFRLIRGGSMAEVTDDVQRVTGRPPIAFAAYARAAAETLCEQL